METSNLIKIKSSGHKPQFKELVGLTKDEGKASLLLDFMRYVHNGKHTCISAQGSEGRVESEKGSYVYTLFTTNILKKDIYRETQTLYKR